MKYLKKFESLDDRPILEPILSEEEAKSVFEKLRKILSILGFKLEIEPSERRIARGIISDKIIYYVLTINLDFDDIDYSILDIIKSTIKNDFPGANKKSYLKIDTYPMDKSNNVCTKIEILITPTANKKPVTGRIVPTEDSENEAIKLILQTIKTRYSILTNKIKVGIFSGLNSFETELETKSIVSQFLDNILNNNIPLTLLHRLIDTINEHDDPHFIYNEIKNKQPELFQYMIDVVGNKIETSSKLGEIGF